MNIQKFNTLLNNFNNTELSENEISELKNLITQYPYFSASHLLYFEYLYKSNNGQYSTFLKKIAHLIPDRKFFFQHTQKIRFQTNITNFKTDSQLNTQNDNQPNVAASLTNPIETINKEINKTIAESIVHSEIIEIKENIKEKVQEIKSKSEAQIIIEPIKEENEIKVEEITSEENKDNTLPNTSFSNLLKKYSHTLQQDSDENNHLKITQKANTDKKEKIKQQQEIIDKIISNPPKTNKISTTQKFFSAENKARESLLETEDLVTETLAQIYAEQGNIHKAIRAYEILSLKFPNKNTYFAAKIKELKEKLTKK
jgi:CRISPR/Cas system-associated endoribonuclease Cas2